MRYFIKNIKILSDSELGDLVLIAAKLRNSIKLTHGVDLLKPALSLEIRPDIIQEIAREIRKHDQSGMHSIASALCVWFHTLHAVSYPSLYPFGVEIWENMTRGFPHANVKSTTMNIEGYDQIPDGLKVPGDPAER